MRYLKTTIVVILAIVIIINVIVLISRSSPIYCIMITGKSKCRNDFAQRAVSNFTEQSYPNKYLIIINHGHHSVLNENIKNINEITINKGTLTLGALRNRALTHVPSNALWTVWDDDDYRVPDYLTFLYTHLKTFDAVCFTRRIEYNYNSGLVWGAELKSGFVTLLARKDPLTQYLDVDTMEDTELISSFTKTVVVQDNNPEIYIRVVHKDNTSLYAHREKYEIYKTLPNANYVEFNVDNATAQNVKHFMRKYYKEPFECMKTL
jgi:hypothetical protein